MATWTIKPGLAALVKIADPADMEYTAIYLSKSLGVVTYLPGKRELHLNDSGLPLQVRAAVNHHFSTVFALEHTEWRGRGPTPRAQYVDALVPWTVEVPDTSEQVT